MQQEPLELATQTCLESVGISLLSDWDVLAFVYHHATCLVSARLIARLSGYDSAVVGEALDRLERAKLIECSRHSQGPSIYRMQGSMDVGRWRCLQQLMCLSESRAGRLLLRARLKPSDRNQGYEKSRPVAQSNGEWACPNAT